MSRDPLPKRRSDPPRARRRRFLAALERLERRELLSLVSWNSDADGSWNDATRWSTGAVPLDGDDVVIDRAAANPTISFPGVGETAYRSLTVKDTLTIVGGKLITTANSEIAGHLLLAGGTVQLNSGTLTLSGTTDWTAGPIYGAVANTGTMNVSGAANKVFAGTLVNTGTITVVGATTNLRLATGGDGTLDNRAGGVVDLRENGTIGYGDTGAGVFKNAGTLRMTAGTSSLLTNQIAFNNVGGTVDVRAGTLYLGRGGASASTGGTFNAVAGATILIGGGGALTGSYTGSGGGSVVIDADTASFDQTTFNFPDGLLSWARGTFYGTLTNAGSLSISGAGNKNIGGQSTLTNTATVAMIGNAVVTLANDYGRGTIDNRPGGVFDFRGDGRVGFGSQGPAEFKNAGTLLKSAGTFSQITNQVAFSNLGGTVDVRAGAMSLDRGGTSTGGTLVVAPGSTLSIGWSGSLSGTYTGSGGGSVVLNAGGGSDGIGFADATLNFPAGMLNWASGSFYGRLTNAGTLTLAGTGTRSLGGSSTLTNTGTLAVNGTFNLGDTYSGGVPTLDNRAGGVVDFRSNVAMVDGSFSAPGVFLNAGTLLVSGGTGSIVRHGGGFSNLGGTVDARVGMLSLVSSGASTGGTYNAAAGATIDLGGLGGSGSLTGRYTGSGGGIVQIDNANFGLINADGAVFDFPPGLLRWIRGGVRGTFTNAGSLTITGPDEKLIYGRLINTGTTVLDSAGSLSLFAPGVLENRPAGVVEFSRGFTNIPTYNGDQRTRLLNDGTIRVDTAAQGQIDAPFVNNGVVALGAGSDLSIRLAAERIPSGTYHVGAGANLGFRGVDWIRENAGTLTLDGPGASVPQLAALSNNVGSLGIGPGARLALSGDLQNSGTLAVSAGGELAIAGGLVLAAPGTIAPEFGLVGSTPNAGVVKVAGSATLGGTLAVTRAGGFALAAGRTFPVLTFAQSSGEFAAFSGLTAGSTPIFQVATTATAVSVGTVGAAADLATSAVAGSTGPQAIGAAVTIGFTVANRGTGPAVGSWTDSVYLSHDGTLSADAVLLGRVPHAGAVAPGSSYSGMLTAAMPVVAVDTYRFVVVADSGGDVADLDRTNNNGRSAGSLTPTVPSFGPGSPVSGRVADGQDLVFRLDIPAGSTVVLTLDGAVGVAELRTKGGQIPIASGADRVAYVPSAARQQVVVQGHGGVEYVVVRGRSPARDGAAFTLTAASQPFTVASVSPNNAAANALVTLTVRGSLFTPAATVALVSVRGGQRSFLPADQVVYQDSGTLYARFALNSANSAGGVTYGLEVSDGGRVASLANAFHTTNIYVSSDRDADGVDPPIRVAINAPSAARVGRDQILTIEYMNTSDRPIPAPVLQLTSSNASFALPGAAAFIPRGIVLLGISQDGPAGLLPAGYRGQITVVARPDVAAAHVVNDYQLGIVPDLEYHDGKVGNTSILLFAGYRPIPSGIGSAPGLRPSGLSDEAWAAIFANFAPVVGDTTKSLHSMLVRDATYLGALGERVADVGRLLSFELARAADFGRLVASHTLGSLGYGQFTLADLTARADAAGDVTIAQGGQRLTFFRQRDGSFLAQPGTVATLTLAAGAYTLRDGDGTVVAFNPDGTFHSKLAPDGTGLVAGYGGGRLVILTDSLGRVTTYAYNAAGRISAETDPAGRVTTYGYDASGALLTSVSDASGTTRLAYDSAGQAAHQPTSIVDPSGVARVIAYDALGRPIATDLAGTGRLTLSYPEDRPGSVAVTDASGATVRYLRDVEGRVIGLLDATGQLARATFDSRGNVTRFAYPDGTRVQGTYDASGGLLALIDPLGNRSEFTYAPTSRRLSSFRDATGNLTVYEINALGQATKATYADGSTESFAYDASGHVVATTDRNGLATTATYASASDDVTHLAYGDGTQASYSYDTHHNLLTATNAQGTTTLVYDAADRLTSITYPNGLGLSYSYDAAGRRTRMTDQAGYAVNYIYDAAGRLSSVLDGAARALVTYTYDATGRLARKDQANGTVSTYTYDANGFVQEIENLGVGGTVLSKFAYTRDARGNPLAMTTLDGTTTYRYDAAGQLVEAALPGGRTLSYAYDAAGNRIASSDGGTTTPYATNNLNQYVSAGGVAYGYDAAGNLVAKTDASGTTTYQYDALGQLVLVASPTLGTFVYFYDALGTRIATTHDGVRTDELIDPSGDGQLVGQFRGGNVVDRYIYGLDLTAQVDPAGGANAYSFDALGSTAVLTSETGAVLNQYAYLPYGEVASSTGTASNPFTFVGGFGVVSDGDGLVWMRNRRYDPVTGRFTQADPIGIAGGLNLYAYASNTPTALIDPQGLQPAPSNSAISNRPIRPSTPVRPPGPRKVEPITPVTPTKTNPDPDPDRYTPSRELEDARDILLITVGVILTTPILIATAPVTVPTVTVTAMAQAAAVFFAFLFFTSAQPADAESVEQRASDDPNDIVGPAGVGAQGFLDVDQSLPYTVNFENKPTASAAAATVRVTQNLSPNLDWDTFQLGPIDFGSFHVDVPAGLSSYRTRVDARVSLGVFVDVWAALDSTTGLATWILSALDPDTLDLPADPDLGLLQPEDGSGRGSGFVSYTIRARDTLPTGTTIPAMASIVFDTNAAIATPAIFNTIDAAAPTASLSPLPTNVGPEFTLIWSGVDDVGGSGIASYDVYGSIDGGLLSPILLGTTATSAPVQGMPGHSYAFAVVATDRVGHRPSAPTNAQTSTTVVTPTVAITLQAPAPVRVGAELVASGSFIANLPGPYSATVDYGDGTGPVPLIPRADATFRLSHSYSQAGSFTVTVRVNDSFGGRSLQTVEVQVAAAETPAPAPTPTPVSKPPTLVSGLGAGRDAFVITLYRELLGRQPGLPELISAARRLKNQPAYHAVARSLTKLKEYKLARKLGQGPHVSLARAFRDAIRARDLAAPPVVPQGPGKYFSRVVVARNPRT